MKIQFENVNFNSRSGPDGFGLKLARRLLDTGHDPLPMQPAWDIQPDVRLTFIQGMNDFKPNVLRLDGIYFNSAQDWERMNEPIKRSYDFADAVIVQSEFDKKLIFKFFGERNNVFVIRNGTDTKIIQKISVAHTNLPREKVWMCASSWRPHKRLLENIELFEKVSSPDSIMLVAGSNAQESAPDYVDHPRISFLGDLPWDSMISYMKASGHFVHLSWLDHCPNVVIDAKVAGCKLHVSEAGGTVELVSSSDLVYRDSSFNLEPLELYNPPKMSLSSYSGLADMKDLRITSCAKSYLEVLRISHESFCTRA